MAHIHESWHMYKPIMAHVQISHGTRTNESWHTCKLVMAHVQIRHGTHAVRAPAMFWVCVTTHIHESCKTYQKIIAHM